MNEPKDKGGSVRSRRQETDGMARTRHMKGGGGDAGLVGWEEKKWTGRGRRNAAGTGLHVAFGPRLDARLGGRVVCQQGVQLSQSPKPMLAAGRCCGAPRYVPRLDPAFSEMRPGGPKSGLAPKPLAWESTPNPSPAPASKTHSGTSASIWTVLRVPAKDRTLSCQKLERSRATLCARKSWAMPLVSRARVAVPDDGQQGETAAGRSHEDVQCSGERTRPDLARPDDSRKTQTPMLPLAPTDARSREIEDRTALDAVPACGGLRLAEPIPSEIAWRRSPASLRAEAFRRTTQSPSLMHVARTPSRSGAPATTAHCQLPEGTRRMTRDGEAASEWAS
ncbi:hypothetical protein CCMA1212_008046 [Trichoderma ghanense]|uniref:Uncharacterized protein n=1 Tax=Trichoderma ghanense TaxID=65468 RepID=A0ABY2GVK9_9HYPO